MTQQVTILQPKAPRAPIATRKPTKAEAKYIADALAFLAMTTPFWAHCLYSEMVIRHTDEVPWAATDAHTIFVNVPGMLDEGWGVEQVAFVLAHEVCHWMFCDLLTSITWRDTGQVITATQVLPYNHDLMNRAMDFRINAALIEGKVGKMPMKNGKPFGCYDPMLSAKGMEGCVEIYEKMATGSGSGQGTQFDEHLEPQPEAVEQEKRIGPLRRAQVVAAAQQAAIAAGLDVLPTCIRRIVGEILEPKVKWFDHLRATMQRSMGQPELDWAKVNKRMISRPVGGRIVFAGESNYGCGTVVIGWDTSGSTATHQELFFSHMAGIVADLNPAELIVMRCDAKVHAVDVLDEPEDLNAYRDMVNEEGIGGGGGTKFFPVFEHIKDNDISPDMVVYLTDCLGSFGDVEPDYPVIWATVRPATPPFGHVVEIEE